MHLAIHVLLTADKDESFAVEIILAVQADCFQRACELARQFVEREYVGRTIERVDGEEGSVAQLRGFRRSSEIVGGGFEMHSEACVEISRINLEFDRPWDVERLLEGDIVKLAFDR